MLKIPKSADNGLQSTHKGVTVVASAFLGIGLWLVAGEVYPSLANALWFTGFLLILFSLITLIFISISAVRSPDKIVGAVIIPLAFGIGIGAVLTLLEHLFTYLWFPYPLDDGEGFCLNQAVRVASGQALYPPVASPPYIVTNYPPVFPWLLSIFTDPNNIRFAPGRLISITSTLVIALTAGGSVRAVTRNNPAGWITGFLILASPVFYFWGALLRVDILATALGMAAFYIAVSAKGPKTYWAIPFLLAAFYTRQSSIEVLIAIVVALFLNGGNGKFFSDSRRKALLLGSLWVILALAALAALQISSDGEFWNHTVVYTRTRFFPMRAVGNIIFIVQTHAILVLLALFALPGSLRLNARRIFGLFFLASVLTSLLSGKVGSDMNYFLNFLVAASMLSGLLFSDISESIAADKSRLALIPFILLIPAAIYQCGFIEGNRNNSFHPRHDARNYGTKVVETLESARGPILSEDEGFCLLSGHEVVFNPFIMSELAREGIWDQTPFLESIGNKEFDLIMLRFFVDDPNNDDRPGVGGNAGWDRFTVEMENAIKESYELDPDAIDLYRNFEPYMRRQWFIYRPKGTLVDSRSVGMSDTKTNTGDIGN